MNVGQAFQDGAYSAKVVLELSSNGYWKGPTWLVKFSEPLAQLDPWDDSVMTATRFVAVSSRPDDTGQTYAFAAEEDGKVLNWTQLDGSVNVRMGHDRVVENILCLQNGHLTKKRLVENND